MGENEMDWGGQQRENRKGTEENPREDCSEEAMEGQTFLKFLIYSSFSGIMI